MRPHVIQRAYQLAAGGRHPDVKSVTHTLVREGYDGHDLAHLRASPLLRQQLARLCKTGKTDAAFRGREDEVFGADA